MEIIFFNSKLIILCVSLALCHVQGGSCWIYKFKPTLLLVIKLNPKR